MIENIELEKGIKAKLQHLSIDKGITLNVLMQKGALYVLENNVIVNEVPKGAEYITYTMNIDGTLKHDIRNYVALNNVLLRDFWTTVSDVILSQEGEL